MVPYSDLSGYITCGETVEINSLDARIWLAIVGPISCLLE